MFAHINCQNTRAKSYPIKTNLISNSDKLKEILDRLDEIEKKLTDLECKPFPPKEYFISKDWINWEREKEETGDYQCLKYTYL